MVVAAISLMPIAAGAQSKVPRTPDGKPDLQGIWDFRTITPLERPNQFAGKETLSADEAATLEQRNAETRVDRAPRPGDPGTYNQFWFDFGSRVVDDKRTSLIVDPADGRLPPLTPEGEKRAAERAERMKQPAEGPEDRPTWERCLLGFNSGPPIMPSGYNNNVQLIQTHDYVVILNEMVHDARIVPISNRPKQRRSPLAGRVARPMGRRHTRRRNAELHDQRHGHDRPARPAVRTAAPHRTLHAAGSPDADLSVHGRRPRHLDTSLDGGSPDAEEHRGYLRVRVPRGQHRDDRHHGRRARAGIVALTEMTVQKIQHGHDAAFVVSCFRACSSR